MTLTTSHEAVPASPGVCPYCLTGTHDPVVACNSCGAVHHRDCFTEAGGCAVLGCSSGGESHVSGSAPGLSFGSSDRSAASTPAASSPLRPPTPTSATPPAGWYPDPSGQRGMRYWDGTQWGSATSSAPTAAPSVAMTTGLESVATDSPGLVMARWALGLAIAGWLIPLLALVGLGLGIGAATKSAPYRRQPQAKGHGLAVAAIVTATIAVLGSIALNL